MHQHKRLPVLQYKSLIFFLIHTAFNLLIFLSMYSVRLTIWIMQCIIKEKFNNNNTELSTTDICFSFFCHDLPKPHYNIHIFIRYAHLFVNNSFSHSHCDFLLENINCHYSHSVFLHPFAFFLFFHILFNCWCLK